MAEVLLGLNQVCKRINTTLATFRKLHCNREFDKIPPMKKLDGKWVILERELDTWILNRYRGEQ